MRTDILERKTEILEWIEQGQPKSFICQELQCKQETLNAYLVKMGIEYKGQQNKKGQQKGPNTYKPALYYIDNQIPIASTKLREKIIKDGLKKDECELCGASLWQGKKLPLELHHINNNHFDNIYHVIEAILLFAHNM